MDEMVINCVFCHPKSSQNYIIYYDFRFKSYEKHLKIELKSIKITIFEN
ncbi:MAG: hypothetical protein ACI8VJ_000730 [Polaribacter sp.]|jgi:hypothetical protein